MHGWDPNSDLPRYVLHCRADNGFPCLVGPKQRFIKYLEDLYPNFKVMYQRIILPRIVRGNMILWPEARNCSVGARFHEDDNLWGQFVELYLLLRSWAELSPSVDINQYSQQYFANRRAPINLSVIPRPSRPAPTGPSAARRGGHFQRKGPGPSNTPKRMAEESRYRNQR
jgi:hypothetical protein